MRTLITVPASEPRGSRGAVSTVLRHSNGCISDYDNCHQRHFSGHKQLRGQKAIRSYPGTCHRALQITSGIPQAHPRLLKPFPRLGTPTLPAARLSGGREETGHEWGGGRKETFVMGIGEQPNLAQKLLLLSPWGKYSSFLPLRSLPPSLSPAPAPRSWDPQALSLPPPQMQLMSLYPSHPSSTMSSPAWPSPEFTREPSSLTREVLYLPGPSPLKAFLWLPSTKIERPRVHLLISPPPLALQPTGPRPPWFPLPGGQMLPPPGDLYHQLNSHHNNLAIPLLGIDPPKGNEDTGIQTPVHTCSPWPMMSG